ncbi:hypothetical protein [Qipengyuania spongiae]|uniref:Phage protein n=1 Tax=Qipengyuania spongiae TaxID=2909673 RepID=A0ABY5SXH0_9SPHN|nr:hypothetical protein [Qipengyuania spongiae]UVI39240.1 hypothetical protein L1F33_13570 [Qipengyuania spongiae]
MNAQTTIKLDEIETFLGPIPADERERREKLRSYRNAASAMLATTRCDTSRHLAWTAIEWISPNIYAPAPIEWLDKLNLLARRLMLTALTAQEMDDLLREGEDA